LAWDFLLNVYLQQLGFKSFKNGSGSRIFVWSIMLQPVKLSDLGGTLKSVAKKKNIKQLMKGVKEGWQ